MVGEVLENFQNAAPDDPYDFGSEAKTCVKMLQGMLKQMAERLPKVKYDTERAEIEKCTKAIENLISVLQVGIRYGIGSGDWCKAWDKS